jgi:hypothetical protein
MYVMVMISKKEDEAYATVRRRLGKGEAKAGREATDKS